MSARFGSEGLGAWVLDRLGVRGRSPRRHGEAAEVDLRTGRTVASVTLRTALALVGTLLVLVAGTMPGGVVPTALLAVLVGLALVAAAAPRWPLTALVLLAVGVRVLAADPAPPLVLAALVLLVHVLLRLTAVAARTTWRTRVEVAVLTDEWRPALAAQVGAQALALLAGAVAVGADDGAWRLVGLATVLGLAVLALTRPAQPWWQRSGG